MPLKRDTKQIRSIAKKVGLSRYQQQQLHREITGQNLAYREILELAYEVKRDYARK
jgi:hypothetical protein